MDAFVGLLEVLEAANLTDRRRPQGRRYPLSAVLALTAVAILTGVRTQEGVVDFGRAHRREFLRLLGFRGRRGPSKATLSRILRSIDIGAFEALIRGWIATRLGKVDFEHIAIDGKTLRGSRDDALPAVHVLTAYAREPRVALVQWRVDADTNEHKKALELLGVLPLAGKVVTADAMFTHKDVCESVCERGGDYVLPVKDNQPNLKKDIEAAFDTTTAGLSPPAERRPRRVLRSGDVAR